MATTYRYKNNWRKKKPNVAKLWPMIQEGVKTPTVWKVLDTVSGFYWTGRANHSKFYDQEGESWPTKDAALRAIQTIVEKASDSEFSVQRLDVRLKAMRSWKIVECKVKVSHIGESHTIDMTEHEVLNEVFKLGRTMGMVFSYAMTDKRSHTVTGLIHLDGYASKIDELLDGMNIPEGIVMRHRTVLEIHDNKWLTLLKLSLPSVKATVNVKEIRERILSHV